MPILTKHQVVRITEVMLQAGGAPAGHAGIVSDHLGQANLAGYDSHGFIRLPQYLKEIEEGVVDPRAEPEGERSAKSDWSRASRWIPPLGLR